MSHEFRKLGPWITAFGAFLWATDALFRSRLVEAYTPLTIVLTSHLICLPFALGFLRKDLKAFFRLETREAVALLTLSGGGSVLAMVFFTEAFATAGNFTVPILIQKLQPVFAAALAALILRERLSRRYLILAGIALTGGYLVTFGPQWAFSALAETVPRPALLALGAAMVWGACTVAGRVLLERHGYLQVTAMRYVFATAILVVVASLAKAWPTRAAFAIDLPIFAGMALGPGLLALVVYYAGLRSTNASIATLCELAFPVGAIVVNWLFLDSPLTLWQLVGASMLLVAVTLLAFENERLKVDTAEIPAAPS